MSPKPNQIYLSSPYPVSGSLLWAVSLLICCCQLSPDCLGIQSYLSQETGVLPLAYGFARNHCPWLMKEMKPRWEKHLLHLHAPKASLTFGEDGDEEERKQSSAGPGPRNQTRLSPVPPESKASHGCVGTVCGSSGRRANLSWSWSFEMCLNPHRIKDFIQLALIPDKY